MQSLKTAIIVTMSTALLQGCAGGSNNANFTSWDAVGASQTVRIDGNVKYKNYTADTNTGAVTPAALQQRDGQLVVSLDAVEDVEALSVDAGPASVGFDEGEGDAILVAGGLIQAASADGQDAAVFGDPDAFGFNYQTFGGWMTGIGSGSGVIGVGSFGVPSNVRAGEVPNIGDATYVGGAGGVAIDAMGVPYLVTSLATVFVDFVDDEFTFSTTNSQVTNLNTAAQFAQPLYDLIGSGLLSGATLSGTVNAVANMSGTIDGTLYGPGAPEVGGTYHLMGPAGQYLGAFGAVEIP
jgi:hypothetical protein